MRPRAEDPRQATIPMEPGTVTMTCAACPDWRIKVTTKAEADAALAGHRRRVHVNPRQATWSFEAFPGVKVHEEVMR